MVLIERVSSLSSSSSSRKTRKIEKQSLTSETDNHELVKGKSVKRASSFSSLKKEKQVLGSPKDGTERLKSKTIQKASSFSSLPSPLRREKLLRGSSSLSSSNVESPKRVRKEKQPESRKSSSLKPKIKDLGPICKRRKEVLNSLKGDEEIEVFFNKQINEGTMLNPEDCFWLSSGSMSPQEFGLFMSALDPCLDEWVISFLPNVSDSPISLKNAMLKGENKLLNEPKESVVSNEVKEGSSSTLKGAILSEEEKVLEEPKEIVVSSEVKDSNMESSLALSTHTNNSAFWNLDRTGVWVSLINLECEDSKLISDAISENEDLDSDFPSPTYESNWDTYSSDLGISSSARSTQESSQSDWSSDLLSDSLDWELESSDPIFWPLGLDLGWEKTLDSFTVSPRKGTIETSPDYENDGNTSTGSIKFRLHGQREGSKDGLKRKILFVSGLSASKIIEFKKGCRNKLGASQRRSKTGKRSNRFGKRVPPILETDLEGISPKETPTKETQDIVTFDSDMMSGSEDNWADEMDSDGPLVWPSDQKNDWNVTCDFLNVSPRKNVINITNFGSPKCGFTVSGSIRLKFRPSKKSKSKSGSNILGLGASKNLKFKHGSHKTVISSKKVKSSPLRLSPSCKSLVVLIPPKRASLFKPVGVNNPGTSRINASHGKRVRAMPLKIGKSVEEFIRMVSAGSVNKKFADDEMASEGNPIENVMGLNEFDGHEGVDMDFEEGNFSFEECI